MKKFLTVLLVLIILGGLGAGVYYAFQPVAIPREGGVIQYEFPVPENAKFLVEEDGYKKWLLTYSPLYSDNVDVTVNLKGELTEGYAVIEMVGKDKNGNEIERKQVRVDSTEKIDLSLSVRKAEGTVDLNVWYKDETKGKFEASFVENIHNYVNWLENGFGK